MTFRTFNAIEQRVANLFAAWQSFSGADVHDGPLDLLGPVTVRDLRDIKLRNMQAILKAANAIASDASFATASAEHQADVNDLIAELSTAEAEITAAVDHDAVWNSLPPIERQKLIGNAIVPDDTKKNLNARIQGKKLQPKPPKK